MENSTHKPDHLVDKVPYYSQWESRDMVEDIIAKRTTAASDPLWRESGALDLCEYLLWSGHICGMACLKMVLASRTGVIWPTLELARKMTFCGGYKVENDKIRGLIYQPFVDCLQREFGMRAKICTNLEVQSLPAVLDCVEFFMASVHHSIRWPDVVPTSKGGHLVLVTAIKDGCVIFHNPSGHTRAAQNDVSMTLERFDVFFAGRGIAIV
jgi:hypothetical protein